MRRAVVVLHGRLRNADAYYRSASKAQAAAGGPGAESLMIAPQFLAGIDLTAHGLSNRTLHWSLVGWEGGEPAEGPTRASSFDALDAILRRLANRKLLPDLAEIVVAGHSGGGQVVQRYAVLGRGEDAAHEAGIRVRYVVANPSSYVWFGSARPDEAVARSCPGYDLWKYGMRGLPPYAAGQNVEAVEQAYARRRVIYLLGTEGTDPNHPALALRQALHDVPGVGHDGDARGCGF